MLQFDIDEAWNFVLEYIISNTNGLLLLNDRIQKHKSVTIIVTLPEINL